MKTNAGGRECLHKHVETIVFFALTFAEYFSINNDIVFARLENLLLRRLTFMKKLLIMLFLSFSLFTLAGCGNDEPPEEGEKIEDVEEEDEIGDGEVDDE
jgi:predicted small lipoprotein YifL